MTTITTQLARNTSVFVINLKGVIEETTIFDHVMASAEKTTSPRGVEHVLFVEEGEDGDAIMWFLKKWQRGGKSEVVAQFETKEEAEEEKYQRVWKYDFLVDDQRDTSYYFSREEAEAIITERTQD